MPGRLLGLAGSQIFGSGVNNFVMPLRRRSDAELLGEALSNPHAFASFYDRYETAIVGYFARRVSDPEIVADLTAEVFAAALHGAEGYRPLQPTAIGWLFTIAHNTLATSVRRRRVEAEARLRVGIRDTVSFTDDELDRVEALASEQGLMALLDGLPRGQRDAIRARVLDERDYPEIATELQCSELVVRKRVSRGLTTLRHQLEQEKQQ